LTGLGRVRLYHAGEVEPQPPLRQRADLERPGKLGHSLISSVFRLLDAHRDATHKSP